MRMGTGAVVGALLAGALSASPVGAQNVSYTTSGTFSGPAAGSCTAGPAPTCIVNGFTVMYKPTVAVDLLANRGGTIPLGSFFIDGSGPRTTTVDGQLFFTLAISQSQPTVGSGSTRGSITGTIQSAGGNFSTLVFSPTNQVIVIDGSTYTLIYDQGVNGIKLAYNGADASNTTLLKGTLTSTTTTPEPASVVLLATGLAGVFGATRRKQTA